MFSRRSIRKATRAIPAWIAVLTIGLHPFAAAAADCQCSLPAIQEIAGQEIPVQSEETDGSENCCSQPQVRTCCSTVDSAAANSDADQLKNSVLQAGCQCDVTQRDCLCDDCSCGLTRDLPSPPPAVPASNESDRTPTTTSKTIGLVADFTNASDQRLSDSNGQTNFSSVLTAQQTCAVLSRFTC